jgi:hypothetical protein
MTSITFGRDVQYRDSATSRTCGNRAGTGGAKDRGDEVLRAQLDLDWLDYKHDAEIQMLRPPGPAGASAGGGGGGGEGNTRSNCSAVISLSTIALSRRADGLILLSILC